MRVCPAKAGLYSVLGDLVSTGGSAESAPEESVPLPGELVVQKARGKAATIKKRVVFDMVIKIIERIEQEKLYQCYPGKDNK
jgi:hypothetical protein